MPSAPSSVAILPKMISQMIDVYKRQGYRSTRIEAWLHPETAGTDAVFQTMMGLYAIGSGGLFGKGLGESLQTVSYTHLDVYKRQVQ